MDSNMIKKVFFSFFKTKNYKISKLFSSLQFIKVKIEALYTPLRIIHRSQVYSLALKKNIYFIT